MSVFVWQHYSETNVRDWELDRYTIDSVSRRVDEFWFFQVQTSEPQMDRVHLMATVKHAIYSSVRLITGFALLARLCRHFLC